MSKRFEGNFTQQDPISKAAIARAIAVLQTGRLHRYNLAQGEIGEVSALEEEYANWQGRKYCLAVTSGGQALQIALRASGVQHGDKVLTNGFTLAPVPGAIQAVGGKSILVEVDENLRIDLSDLEKKIRSSGAKFLLLSHMRGHLCDMVALMEICEAHGVLVIEDCAHTMGAKWKGIRSGNFGEVACFSTQTYKHINSGEGGFLVTDNPEIAARATILSGSYMLYERHGASPSREIFEKIKLETPNCSARMDALRAAILRPQLATLDENVKRWNARYDALYKTLKNHQRMALAHHEDEEYRVGSSFQFRIPDFNANDCQNFVKNAARRGVELKWFGNKTPAGFTSNHQSWAYVEPQNLPETDRILSTVFDLRLPLTFSVEDCEFIGEMIIASLEDA